MLGLENIFHTCLGPTLRFVLSGCAAQIYTKCVFRKKYHSTMHQCLPLSFAGIISCGAILSDDGRLVRASLAMLHAAWAAPAPGRLPASHAALAQITGLSLEEVAANMDLLSDGWIRCDTVLCHPQLEQAWAQLEDRFGPELEVMRASWLSAVQPGGAAPPFELVPPAAVAQARVRGRHRLPKDFTIDSTTFRQVVALGYATDEQRQWLLQRFRDYAAESSDMRRDWQASLRNYAGSAYTARDFQAHFGRPLSRAGTALHATRSRPTTFARETAMTNASAMDRAIAEALGQGGARP